jgi:hypothetical protein
VIIIRVVNSEIDTHVVVVVVVVYIQHTLSVAGGTKEYVAGTFDYPVLWWFSQYRGSPSSCRAPNICRLSVA